MTPQTLVVEALRRVPFAQAWRSQRQFWRAYNGEGDWELALLPELVDPNRLALDVGGNRGLYAYHLRRLARDVAVFEPNPRFADILKRIGFAGRLHEVALSDADGRLQLRLPLREGREDAGMGSLEASAVPDSALHRTLEVPVRTLDSFGFEDVGFIKIDVEGHEEAVLRGGAELLRRCRPTLVIEIEERHAPGALGRVRRLLADWDASFVLRGERLPIEAFDPRLHQDPAELIKAYRDTRSAGYVANFIFTPRG